MSIATEISRIKSNVQEAFAAIRTKGGTVSENNSDALASAIGTIPDAEPMPALVTGTYTVGSSDISTYINVSGLIYPQAFIFDIDYDTAVRLAVQTNQNVVWRVLCFSRKQNSEHAALVYVDQIGVQHPSIAPIGCNSNRTRIYLLLSGIADVNAVFPAAAEYRWTAYDWRNDT